MRGWRYESARHSLAAKGIQTSRKRYFSPFVDKTTIPAIDYPDKFNSFREMSSVKMAPDEFLRLAKKTSEYSERVRSGGKDHKIKDMTQEEYEASVREEKKVERVKEGLAEGKDIPAGHIEFGANDGGPEDHEGRHRAFAARDLGMKEIPVVLVRSRELKRNKEFGFMSGSWVYGKDEFEKTKYGEDLKRKVLPFNDKYLAKKSDVEKEELKKWRQNVNMSSTEIKTFMSQYGDTAGLSRKEALKEGIKSGRDSARAIIRMKSKPVAKWTEGDVEWMRRQNSFVARMRGARGSLYDEKGQPTRKLLALKVWGHDPEKRGAM